MYAQLCKRLTEEAPNFAPPNGPCTFRLLLLNKCKVEFEQRSAILEQYGTKDQTLEDEERRHLAKRKMLGNIKFIGELGKLEILSETILHRCIQELLGTKRRGDDPSEDLECLCQIMRTCGRILDSDKGKKLMDQYFERMSVLADNPELQPRIRFMLKDVIDLRLEGWAPRKVAAVEGPVPIHQIRPVEEERQVFRRERNQDRDFDRSNSDVLFRHSMKTRGGIEDMFISMNLSSSTTNLIPTHPFSPNGFGGQRDGGFRGHNNQRSGFNNYNNQRGQYKHNQNNSNSQYNNQSNKEVAPRFKKNLAALQSLGELELRPPPNSLCNKASVKTNNMMNTRPIDPPLTKQPAMPLTKDSLPIKQVSTEKPKQAKKEKGPNKEEVLKKFTALIEEYLRGDANIQQAVDSYREHKVPDKFAKDAIFSGLKTFTTSKTTEEKQKFITLLSNLKKEKLLSQQVIHDAFKSACNLIDECENEKEKIISSMSVLIATSVKENILLLADLGSFTEHGAYYPLFLCTMQEIRDVFGEKELTKSFADSKIQLLAQLPENDRTKERLAEILGEKRLTFLCPMLQLEADLAKQLQTDPNPQQFYKWIKDNLDSIDFTEPGFITALMTVLLKYITQEAASAGDDKAVAEKEKTLLDMYQPILHAFLQEKPELQLVAVYALQVHFYAQGFPRGQLLKWFYALYSLSIVEEEAFLTWKEDVTDVYPGKGNALFQVNQWLTWLQDAESEEEEEGDE